MTAAMPWPRGGCPGSVPSVLPVLGDFRGASAVQGWGAAGIWRDGGVTPRGESWAVGRRSSPEAALLCPRDCPPPAVSSAMPGPSPCLSVPCPSLPFRRIEELAQELAASNRLVETLSAEKRDLQQRLEEPPAVGGQVGGQAWGDASPAPQGGRSAPTQDSAGGCHVEAGSIPHLHSCAWESRGGRQDPVRVSGERPPVLLRVSVPPAPVCHLNPGS